MCSLSKCRDITNYIVSMRPDGSLDWKVRPAYLMVEVTNPADPANPESQVTDRVTMHLSLDPVGDPDYETYHESVFDAPAIAVPSLAPGQTMQIPVFLSEYTQYRMMDNNIQAGQWRFWNRYNHMPMKVTLTTSFDNSRTKNQHKNQETVTLPTCTANWKAK